jgi:hypothetical protein
MKVFRKANAVLLLMLVLISSSSFMVGIHFCGGQIQNIALFDKADGCEKEKQLPPCHRHETPACCQDTAIIHEGEGFSQANPQLEIVHMPVFNLEQFHILISEIIPDAPAKGVEFYSYDPPLRAPDLTISLQTFLI